MSLGYRRSPVAILAALVLALLVTPAVSSPATVKKDAAARAQGLLAAFDTEAALESAAFADQFSRAPGSRGYDIVLDEFAASLRAAGFGTSAGLDLEIVEVELPGPAWEGRAASVSLSSADGAEDEELHAFFAPADRDRAILPRNAPSVDVVGDAVFALEDVFPGSILVTRSHVRPDLLRRAASRGASAVVSASLATFNVRPDSDAHVDAVQVRELLPRTELPVLQISPSSYAAIRASREPRLTLFADVAYGASSARVLVARIEGVERKGETVALVAHLQGSSASDDASGAAGLLESARTAARLLRARDLPRPQRGLTFVFGPEVLQAERWLETTLDVAVAAVGVLGIGTGDGRLVLERGPDPGALPTNDLDLDPAGFAPNALASFAHLALDDVSGAVGGWTFDEEPYEGGSNPDPFLRAGVPAVLFWARPGPETRTSLDRFERIDREALRRAAVAALATAWTIADPAPEDLARCALLLERECFARVGDALQRDDPEQAEAWARWLDGASTWLARRAR